MRMDLWGKEAGDKGVKFQELDLEERSQAISRIGLNSNKTTLRGHFISCFARGTHLF